MPNNNGLSYDELFDKYLATIDTAEGDLVLPLLKKSRASTNSRIEILVPEAWSKEITKKVLNISQLYSELRTRTTDSDVILPDLISNLGSPLRRPFVNWPGESIDVEEDVDPKIKKRLEFHPSPIEINLHVAEYINRADNLQSILDSMMYDIARLIDESVISPVSYMNNNPIESILTSEGVYDHESTGMQGVAGYIDNTDTDLNSFNPKTIKETLFHMPRGYRQRAKWIMNSETAMALEEMRIKVNNGDPSIDDNWSPLANRRLLNKPVILNEYMPSKGIIIILADLTRGYQISKYFQDMHLIITPRSIGLRFKIAGKVLQPAAFKGVRCTYTYEIPEIDYSMVELKPEYDEDGNEAIY
jgi:HK97 family phage major capsid protein